MPNIYIEPEVDIVYAKILKQYDPIAVHELGLMEFRTDCVNVNIGHVVELSS